MQNSLHLLWTILNMKFFLWFKRKSLILLLFSPLRASRGQLSTTNLPSGGSEGFNQCTEDLVETRGESWPQLSHGHLSVYLHLTLAWVYTCTDGYCYTAGGRHQCLVLSPWCVSVANNRLLSVHFSSLNVVCFGFAGDWAHQWGTRPYQAQPSH